MKEVQFVGLKANFAQAYWLVVWKVYNKGKEMIKHERSYHFHFEENLHKWMDDHVAPTSRKAHVDLVHAQKDSRTKDEVDQNYAKIWHWWTSSNVISIESAKKLERWLS